MNDQVDKNALWLQSGGDDLLKGQTFQKFFDGLPDKEITLSLADRNLRCIDEGTTGGVHLGGSGILYPEVAADLKGKVSGVYSHQGCGAAAKYVTDNHLSTADPDTVGDEQAKRIAQALNVPYLGRISADQMSRPAGLHIARAVYVALEDFDPSRLSKLPKGFISNRNLISDSNYAKAEIELCCQISLGGHGFGKLFTAASPFYIVVVSKSSTDPGFKYQVLQEAETVADKFPNVRVESITL